MADARHRRLRSRHAMARPSRKWALRGGFAAGALVLGYISTIQALAVATARSDLPRAHALYPGSGWIGARLAEQISAGKVDAAARARADRIARQALDAEPLAAPALTALALNAELRGDRATAGRLFRHSDALSRRDLGTRLWLIEDAVTRGDVPGVLRHYDIALRTARGAPDLLFPVLSTAITDPVVADALASTLAHRPPWSDAFVQYLATSGPDARSTARLFRRLAQTRTPLPEIATANAVNSLITANAFNAAWDYYRTLRAGTDRRRSRDIDFRAQLEIPTAFDWVPVMTEPGVAASIQHSAGGGLFDFAAPPTVGGPVLQQMQVLPAGRYRLAGHSIGIEQPPDSRPYWTLMCTDGREIGRVDVPNSTVDNGRFTGMFTVPARCPAQVLRLIARPSNAMSGAAGQIDHVALWPA